MLNARYELAKLTRDYTLNEISQKFKRGKPVPSPYYVGWDCTRACNLHCLHCGATKERYPKELDTGQIKRVINELAALRVRMFAATGGEPLLRADMLEVMGYASAKGLKTGIATNGHMIDAELARELQRANVSSIQVSLDGPEGVHNAIRGDRESFKNAVNAIRQLTACGIPILSVATTVTPWNIGALEPLRDLLLELKVRQWRLAIALPIGRATLPQLHLNGGQIATLLEFAASNRRHLNIQIGENLTFLGPWERKIRDGPSFCPIGLAACCIGVDGHMRGCPEQPDTPENREGSILESSFAGIWQRGFGKYRARDIVERDVYCRRCRARYDCLGGCWVMRQSNLHCIYQRLEGTCRT
jgi:radical SAM protein with 4Fe4S-binding SPASM domain